MLKRFAQGAAATLIAGLLSVGCSSDGDTIIIGSSGDLNNQDVFYATSIAENNLAPDGGGFSPNDTDTNSFRVIWCNTTCEALVFFKAEAGGVFRLFVSHYNGSSFTPPAELEAEDRDEGADVNLDAIVAARLNTSGYAGTAGNEAAAATARGNDGCWVFTYSSRTFFEDPRLGADALPANTTRGKHQEIWSHVFLPALRGTALGTSDRVGGTTRNFRYGFQETGSLVTLPEYRMGERDVVSTTGGNTGLFPASDVVAFGYVTDAYYGQASFGSNALPFTGPTQVLNDPDSTAFTKAIPNLIGDEFTSSDFDCRDPMSFLQLVYTQMENCLSNSTNRINAGNGALIGGEELQAFVSSFNLSTLAWETPSKLEPTSSRNSDASNRSCGTQTFPSMHSYNNTLFFKYVDGSLGDTVTANADFRTLGTNSTATYTDTGGHVNGDVSGKLSTDTYYAEFIDRVNFVDDGDGTSSIATDAATRGALNFRTLNNTDVININAAVPLTITREIHNFLGNSSIFGADEGLEETVLFFTGSDNIRTGSTPTDRNVDRMLLCASFENANGTIGAKIAGTNPRILSEHAGDEDKSDTVVDSQVLRDPVSEISLRMNRTGEYVNIAYIENRGVSTDFHTALQVVTFQTFRDATGGNTTTPSLDIRAAGPTVLSANGSTFADLVPSFPGQAAVTNPDPLGQTARRWNHLPVNALTWQEGLEYKCGFQSDRNIMHIAWEQSDATEDRVFVNRVAVNLGDLSGGTAPSHTAGTVVELENASSDRVQGFENYEDSVSADGVAGAGRSDFRFLNGEAGSNSFNFKMMDLGQDSTSTATSVGGVGVLIVFRKVVDATTSDNDHGDSAVIAVQYRNAALTADDRAVICTRVDENFSLAGPAATKPGNNTTSTQTNQSKGKAGGTIKLVATPVNADPVTFPNAGPNRIDVFFTDVNGNNNSAPVALFHRVDEVFDRVNALSTNTTLGLRFEPNADNVAGNFAAPHRLDHSLGQDVTNVETCQSGNSVLALFQQDGHVWAQLTTTGRDVLSLGGAPNPALVDNDSSENVISYSLNCCEPLCDAINGMVLFRKRDTGSNNATQNGDIRLRIRAALRLQ